MRLSSQTNKAYLIGTGTNVLAKRSGYVWFRSNLSLPIDVSGEIRVRVMVTSDADSDGVSDYEELHVWHTDPLDPDSDGDGFSDLEEVMDKKARAIPVEDDKSEDEDEDEDKDEDEED
ncbi:hypothetical protein ACFLQR_00225 [Verrucomicrobiota bacterium]